MYLARHNNFYGTERAQELKNRKWSTDFQAKIKTRIIDFFCFNKFQTTERP